MLIDSSTLQAPAGTCGASAAESPLDAVETAAWRAMRGANERLMAELSRELAETVGISLSEYEILLRLSESPGGRLRMSSLAVETGQSRSRLTHAVGRLETRDLVNRFTCDSDKRGIHCGLTEGGRKFLAGAAPGHLRAVKKYFLDSFSRQELTTVTDLLSKIAGPESEI